MILNRFYTFLILAITLPISHTECQTSDTTLVNEVFLNRPLTEVLQVFESKYDCLLAYEENDIADVFVHRYLTNLSIDEALRDVLNNSGLEYQLLGNSEVLIRRDRSLPEGQDITINGRIVSESLQSPLGWATVVDSSSQRVAFTDEQGRFSLKIFGAPASGILNVNYLGYQDGTVVWSRKENDVFVTMKPTNYELSEVVVTEKIPTLTNKSLGSQYRQKVSLKNLTLASPGMKDEMRILQMLPGISATNDLSAGISVRGGDENQSLYLLDGIEFFNVEHFFGIFSAFDPNTIDSTSIYLSDFPIRYGGRTSGVVDMQLRSPAGADLNGVIGVHSLYSLFNLETKITKKSGILFSTRFTNGDISDDDLYDVLFSNTEMPRMVSESRQQLNEVVPFFRFTDSQLKWQWTPNNTTSVSATVFRGRDESNTEYNLQYLGRFQNLRSVNTEEYDEKLSWDNTGFNLSFDHEVSKDWRFEFDLSTNEYRLDQSIVTKLKRVTARSQDSLRLENITRNVIQGGKIKWNNNFRVFENHELEAGVEAETHRTSSLATNATFLINREARDTLQNRLDTAINFSVFGSYKLPLSKNSSLSMGLRFNRYSPTQSTFLSPRVKLSYFPTKHLTFDFSAGVYNQFLRTLTYEDRFGKSHDLWLLSKAHNSVLKSYHSNLAARYQNGPFTFNLELYNKNSKNELVQVWLVNGFNNSNAPSADSSRVFRGTGHYQGVNIFSKYSSDRYQVSLSYTLSKNTLSVPQIDQGQAFPASNDRRHELSLINILSLGKWTLANTLVYGSGYPYVSSILVDNRDIRNLEFEERIARLPDYFRVDFAVDFQFSLWKENFHAGLSIYNLLDRQNSNQVQYLFNLNAQNSGSEDYVIGSEINLLPRTIDISLEWHF